MKKYLPFLLLLVLIACISQIDDSDINTMRAALPERSHLFSFDSAAILISNILVHPVLGNLTRTYSSGATFPASQLKLNPNSVGIIFWYCFKPGKNPEFFLATEQLENYDMKKLPQRPVANTLLVPQFTFKSESQISMVADVKNLLISQFTSSVGVKSVSSALINQYVMSFDSLMNVLADEKGNKYNQYPFSFFARNKAKDLELFLAQAGDDGFIKYYFGYDENDSPNRIRVILVSGNVSGKNNVETRQKEDPLILQKSWPPPVDGTND